MNLRSLPSVKAQRGAVLVVSLLLLLVMTLLALGASQSTRLQERMAGNQRDMDLALQGAEAGLRGAEELLAPTVATIATCLAPASHCEAYEQGVLPLDLTRQNQAWWNQWGRDYAVTTLGSLSSQPEFVIEHIGEVRDSIAVGGSYLNTVRDYHRSTARSNGMTPTAEVILQSSHARISFE
ncbi:MAG TPA: PilX N-terminal domain-containing pilus assembly protein [Steroidobacter sp.]